MGGGREVVEEDEARTASQRQWVVNGNFFNLKTALKRS
jgi:hypothetical protein